MLIYTATDGGLGSLNEALKEARHLVSVLEDPALWDQVLAVPYVLAGQLQTDPHNATKATVQFDDDGLTITVRRVDDP